MLKLKYNTLSKEEKNKVKNDFYKTEFGLSIKKRLDRLFIIGILSILFSLYLFIMPSNKWDIVTAVILVIAALIFITGSFKVRTDKINTFLTTKKK